MSIVKKIGRLIFVFFLALIIVSLLTNVISLLRQKIIIEQETQALEKLEQENQQLLAQLDYVESDEFIEREARDSLGLSKGETIAILPSDLEKNKYQEDVSLDQKASWRRWWELLTAR